MNQNDLSRRWKRYGLHLLRVVLFSAIIGLIHLQRQPKARLPDPPLAPVQIDRLRKFFPDAHTIVDEGSRVGRREVLDPSGNPIGYIVQTSPASDDLIGFSGPTNTLIAFGPDDRIVGIHILSSGDTREHVAQVMTDESFLNSFDGLSWDEAAGSTPVDAVSGATLTSLAIQESIIHRLSGGRKSLRFPDPLVTDDARAVFETAASIRQDEGILSLWHVMDTKGYEIGSILRTSPAADNIIGFQGPTEARICFDFTGRIVGISIGTSYDNEPYVTYVRDDEYFLALFNDLKLEDLADLDLRQAGVEGVSGATMTSMAIADGLIVAAEEHRKSLEAAAQRATGKRLQWSLRDFGTGAVIAGGLLIGLTSLRGNRYLRIGFQVVLVVYLGLINGDLLSQAMLVGWAQSGIPWSKAGGLVLLTAAAFVVPITVGRNCYCTHLCPHGAAQQLLKNRLPWRLQLPRRMMPFLKAVPAVLLAWCLIVAMASLPFSLVDIEPFDAWVFRVAGWSTITIAVVGLIASLFVPMAYCRYGCPTGAILNFLRLNTQSDRWTRRDWFAVVLTMFAFGWWFAAAA